MGFPSIVVVHGYNDPYDDSVMPVSGDKPPREKVLQNLHVSTCFQQLARVLVIRKKAEEIFTRVFSDCTELNERLAKLDERMQDLKAQSLGIQKLMENHSPESFMGVSADEIVSLVHRVPGGLFNRSSSPAEVNARRDEATELIPLNKFNRFWPCLETSVGHPATRDWICAHAYTNPRFFFERWVEDQSTWRDKQQEKKEEMKRFFSDRRNKEIEESKVAIIVPIERNYVDDRGAHYVKKVGIERDLGYYNRVEDRLLKRERSTKKLVYGTGTILESSDIHEEEAYQLKELEEEDELPEEIGTPLQAKRLSKAPVPNLHKPIDTPNFDDPVAKFLETGRTPGGSLSVNGPPPDDGLSLIKNSSMRMMDAIRKGSRVGDLRAAGNGRTLPRVPRASQSDVIYSGMKERFESRAEEEGASDLPRLPEQLSVDPMAIDAPPLPSRSPHEPLALAEKSNTSQSGEPSPRRSPSPDVFQPGSLKAEAFYKSESNHPVPPVPPPRTGPTPNSSFQILSQKQ